MSCERTYTVGKHIESYGFVWLDYNGYETDRECPMTLKQANYLAKYWGGFVKEIEP